MLANVSGRSILKAFPAKDDRTDPRSPLCRPFAGSAMQRASFLDYPPLKWCWLIVAIVLLPPMARCQDAEPEEPVAFYTPQGAPVDAAEAIENSRTIAEWCRIATAARTAEQRLAACRALEAIVKYAEDADSAIPEQETIAVAALAVVQQGEDKTVSPPAYSRGIGLEIERREIAFDILGRTGTLADLRPLGQIMRDRQEGYYTRRWAMDAMVLIGGGDDAVPAVLKMIETKRTNPYLVRYGIESLGRIGTDAAREALLRARNKLPASYHDLIDEQLDAIELGVP